MFKKIDTKFIHIATMFPVGLPGFRSCGVHKDKDVPYIARMVMISWYQFWYRNVIFNADMDPW